MDAVAADSRNTLVLEDALRAAEGRASRRCVEWSRGAESGADFGRRFECSGEDRRLGVGLNPL